MVVFCYHSVKKKQKKTELKTIEGVYESTNKQKQCNNENKEQRSRTLNPEQRKQGTRNKGPADRTRL